MGAQAGFVTAAGLHLFSPSNTFIMQIHLAVDATIVSAHEALSSSMQFKQRVLACVLVCKAEVSTQRFYMCSEALVVFQQC